MTVFPMAAEAESLVARGLRQSRRLRLRPADSRWLITEAVGHIAHAIPDGTEAERMRLHLAGMIRRRYGNPLVVWLLLNIVLPVVVQLVIEWWLRRQEARRG